MEKPSILYHYCTSQTFISIVENKRIRLSSLSQSNDSLEGKILKDRLVQLAIEFGWSVSEVEVLRRLTESFERANESVGFCLSGNGDLLSQWRGYTDDAQGFSIGFSREALESLNRADRSNRSNRFVLRPIEYREENQLNLIREPFRDIIKSKTEDITFSSARAVKGGSVENEHVRQEKALVKMKRVMVVLFLKYRFQLKAEAFMEEQEWRLFDYLTRSEPGLKFRAKRNCIVPFVESVELSPNAIDSVIIGPKNTTPKSVFESLLRNSGFTAVKVTRSKASYI
jgi:hypothetical protein